MEPRFPRYSHTSDLTTGTLLATLPGTWRSRISATTCWPGVSIVCLAETVKLKLQLLSQCGSTCHLSRQIRPRHTLACCGDLKQAANEHLGLNPPIQRLPPKAVRPGHPATPVIQEKFAARGELVTATTRKLGCDRSKTKQRRTTRRQTFSSTRRRSVYSPRAFALFFCGITSLCYWTQKTLLSSMCEVYNHTRR